jgi:hypothetical protein
VAALGVAYLLSQLGDQGGTAALGTTISATTPAKITVTGASKISESPTTTRAAPSTTSTSSPAHSKSATAAPDPHAGKRLENFVSSYYSEVTNDRGRTWNQLTPRMQNAAGGRGGYDGFWKTIVKVNVKRTRVSASGKRAVVNLAFTRNDGTTSSETHQFTFVTNGGNYLIDSEQNVG